MTNKSESNDTFEDLNKIFDILFTVIFIIILIAIFSSISAIFSQAFISITGRTIELEAILTGSILPNKPISFYYRKSGELNWIYIDTVYTDSEGKARKIINLQHGKYDFKAIFEGDENYDGSYDEKLNIEI